MLKVHVLNVGDGSTTIVEFDSDRIAVIDLYNLGSKDNDELTDPIDYIGGSEIFRFILTHPEMDHMSGLNELVEGGASLLNFWDTTHNREIEDDSWEDAHYQKEDWEMYQQLRESDSDPKVLRLRRGAEGDYYTQDGLSILAPTEALEDEVRQSDDPDFNDLSYVLRLEYNGFSMILGGDATPKVWDDIFENESSELPADVFLAPHHGSPNNRHEDAFNEISPDDVVVSVHEGQDYDYDFYNNLASNQVWSTKHHGDITITVYSSGNYEISSD